MAKLLYSCTRCLRKKLRLLFQEFMYVKYEPITIKIGRIVPEQTLNKIVPKCPLHLVLALPWEIQDAIFIIKCIFV